MIQKSDIAKGFLYTNGRGTVREVIYISATGEWVTYRLIQMGEARGQRVGLTYNCSGKAFVKWAAKVLQ